MAVTTLERGHAFISYVREDVEQVDRLQEVLEDAGIPVWRDLRDIQPGDEWKGELRQAIADAEVFVACFSDHYLARPAPYLNEELMVAIEQVRRRHIKPRWFFPVRLSDCEIPDREIDPTRTLLSFNWIDLFDDRWDEGTRRLIGAILEGRRPHPPQPSAGVTRREVPAGTAPGHRTRRDGTGPVDPYISVVLPAPLAERFRVLGEVPTQGAEATVMVAEELASGATRLLKLYRRGIELDSDAVEHLTTLSQSEEGRAHIVTLYEAGMVAGRWYEVQELCPHRSLREVLRPHRVDPGALAAELGEALGFLEGRLFMRDLKPENLLVRSVDPLDVVVGDFGLARSAQAGSVRWTEAGTAAYMPPEAGRNRLTRAWDWWSAGMVIAEVALGRHPLADADGHLPPSLQILDLVNRAPVELSGIADGHLRHLCRGLLVRDPDRRWRAEQVRAWLAGERPDVPDDETRPDAGDRTPVAVQTAAVQFLGRACSDPASLATAFQARWEHARDWLFADGAPTWWRRQVVGLLRAHDCTHAAELVEHGMHAAPANVHEAMAQLLLEMNPDLQPVFNGIEVTRKGLYRAALRAKGDTGAAPRLEEVRLGGVLTLWDSLPGMAGTAEIDLDWQDGCRRIDDYLYGLLHGAIEQGGRLGEELRAAAKRANAWLLLCAVDGSGRDVADLWGALNAARSSPAIEIPWWRWLADSSEESHQALPAAVLAVVTERYARFSREKWIDRPKGGNRDEP